MNEEQTKIGDEKRKVMVVDDEFTIRELIALTLEPDFEVIKAESGEDALQKLNQKPELIILDVMMPRIDGYKICNLLKSNEETKHIPIIMLTAKHQAEDVENAVDAGADEYITKPFEPTILKKSVEAYFSKEKIERKLSQYGKSIHYIKGRDEKSS